MKHIYFTCLLTAISFFTSAQYTRSLYYEEKGGEALYSAIVPGAEYTMSFNVYGSVDDTLRLSYCKVINNGNVTGSSEISLVNSLFETTTLLSGVSEEYNNRFTLVLILQTENKQRLAYIEVNTVTNTITQSYFPPALYNTGYNKARQSGTGVVNYMVNDNLGFQRIFHTPGSFSSQAIENVDNSINNTISMTQGRKHNEVLVVDETEYILSSRQGGARLFRRTAAGGYTSTDLFGNSASTHLDITQVNNGTIAALVNDSCYIFSLISFPSYTSGLMVSPEVSGLPGAISEFMYYSGSYYKIRSYSTQTLIISKFSPSMDHISSEKLKGSYRIMSADVINNKVYIAGDVTNLAFTQLKSHSFNDIQLSRVPFLSLTSEWPAFNKVDEYNFNFSQNNMSFILGQSGKFFSPGVNNFLGASLNYNDTLRSVCYAGKSIFAAGNGTQLAGENADLFSTMLSPGPYTTAGNYNMDDYSAYNRGFYVTRQMILDHIAAINQGTPGYIPPHGIAEWPGNGNVTKGQAAQLAAFRDNDGDGVYEPMSGDYPIIYGDKCFFTIAHDSPSNPVSSHIELQNYAYTFSTSDCSGEPAYENTVFIRQVYIARNGGYDSLYTGMGMDWEIGGYNDDYTGTNVDLSLIYCINADLYDESSSNSAGFGEKLAAVGLMYLKGAKAADDETDNPVGIGMSESPNGYGFGDGIQDNEHYGLESSLVTSSYSFTEEGDPQNLGEIANVLRGLYRSGLSKSYGSTSLKTKYSYPGNTDTYFYGTDGVDPQEIWDEITVGNPGGDRRVYGGTKPVPIAANDSVIVDLAYVVAFDPELEITTVRDPLNYLFELAGDIRADYNANTGPCGSSFDPADYLKIEDPALKGKFVLYPNPATGVFHIKGIDEECNVSVFDVNGRQVVSLKMNSANNSVDLSGWNGSVFFVKLENSNGSSVLRLVKTN